MNYNPKYKNDKKKSWIQKQWQNILFFIILALFIIPQTRKPIQVTINRVFSFSPSTIDEKERPELSSYNWRLRSLNGQQLNFTQSQNKPVVLNFWATWCPPCIAEMPSLQNLYDDYKDKVDFYFVTNEDRKAIEKFTSKNDYDLPIYNPLEQQPEPLQASSLPTTYIIDKNGKVHIQKVGAADWNSDEVRDLLDSMY